VEPGLASNTGAGPAAPLLIKSAGRNNKTATPESARTRLNRLILFDFCERGSPNLPLVSEPEAPRRQLRSINFDS